MKAIPAKKQSARPGAIPQREIQDFEPLEHSVYVGRKRLGRYERIAKTKYAAYDAEDRPLGEFSRRRDAYAVVAGISGGRDQ